MATRLESARPASAPALTAEDQLHWLALLMAPGLGPRKAGDLLRHFRSPQAILRASRSELEALGIPGSVAQSLASGCSFEEAVLQQQKMAEAGATLITLFDPCYPARLKEIYDPPVVLYARGRLELLDTPVVAIVGTRRPTPYGLAVASRLAGDLVREGLTIASGMARGIDTAAHRGALAASGNTLAVFGCGIDIVYPSDNRKLAAEIAETGLLLSEFPMATPAHPQNFPIRNRVISGLSAGVVVVEAAQYSGSAITARLAIDQGREVFAVPGSITSQKSWGPNLLIKQGAKLVQDFADVIEELPPDDRRWLAARTGRSSVSGNGAVAGGPEQLLLSLGANAPIARAVLGTLKVEEATHIDRILEVVESCSSSEVIAALFELEMLGLVRQLPGRSYVKVW